jgi:starch synthase
VEAENNKLKDKIKKVKARRKTSKKKSKVATNKESMSDDPSEAERNIDVELAQIEQLRAENEKLRRLAEERLRMITEGDDQLGLVESSSADEEEYVISQQQHEEEEVAHDTVEKKDKKVEAKAKAKPEPEEEETPEEVVRQESKVSVRDILSSAVGEQVVKDEEKQQQQQQQKKEEEEAEGTNQPGFDLDSHDASEMIKNKGHFLYFTVPEKPRAGEDAMMYFNRASSTVLRDRPSIKMILSFNGWELGSETYSLSPSSTQKDKYNDWWSCRMPMKEDSYEMNFVFHDDDGHFDNNGGQDYVNEVTGKMTKAKWQEGSAERADLREEERLEREAKEMDEEEKRRRAATEEADRNEALALIGDARNNWATLQAGAATNVTRGGQVVFATKPAALVAGQKCVFIYNASNGPLDGSNQVKLEIAYNGWKSPVTMEMEKQATYQEGNVWYAELDVAPQAVVLNAVLFNEHKTYDNNGSSNFNLIVDIQGDKESYWNRVTDTLQAEIKQNRLEAEARQQERLKRSVERKKRAKEYSVEVSRRKLSHILYTEPSEIVAGETVELFYNTDNTALKGQADSTFLQYSFNRWSHPDTFAPVQMQTTQQPGSSWVSAQVEVPEDAYMLDFVFGDSAQGGNTFDNNEGLDYHLSVNGGPQSPPLYICHIAVEMAPIAKVGGLGDVVTALARAVQEHGHHSEIILPRYDFLISSPLLQGIQFETELDWGGCKNYVTTCIVEGVRVFFIEPSNGIFKVPSVYSTQNEDNAKFDFFCKCALEFLLQTGRQPDILHCHDWSSAPAAPSYWNDYHPYGLWKPKVVFTIHNLDFGAAQIGEAAMHSQKFTTVSPSYAYEVGDHPAVNPHIGKFSGIINGIDTDIWDPMDDQFLPVHYSSDNTREGKSAARDALRDRLGLRKDRDCPVIGVVSRLTNQKGIHLIKHAAYRTLDRGGQFVLLGSAPDPKIQADFNDLASQLGGDMGAFYYAYDEPLSHLIYAGCDMILVPSMFEPCGLTQMIAMRYGSVPVVRQTGGLRDTVFDVDHDKERGAWEIHGSDDYTRPGMDGTNGFSFEGTDESSLDYALNRAMDCWYNERELFHELQERVMGQDWSWNKPALDYIELYYSAIKS